jgi:hypothetical protein
MTAGGPWTTDRAHDWAASRGWRVGCNFAPSSASNQLEMWRRETFDLDTIDRELGWAADLGFTSMRVFLHDLPWQHDRDGFVDRIERYLDCAHCHGIATLFVLFDGVWNPVPEWGPQPEPRPRVHNSRWVQSPGAALLGDPTRHSSLAPYVQGVLDHFRDDPRIDGWDLFNEPDNPNPAYRDGELPPAQKWKCALELTRRVFAWAREVGPSQPLTVGVWRRSWSDPDSLDELDRVCLEHSDVISFHHYGELPALERRVDALRRYARPIWCTEWLARSAGSRFDPHLAWMKAASVGAYGWGLVTGRTQTRYPWESWVRDFGDDPEPWHHDILRPDGAAYDPREIELIRRVTGASGARRAPSGR